MQKNPELELRDALQHLVDRYGLADALSFFQRFDVRSRPVILINQHPNFVGCFVTEHFRIASDGLQNVARRGLSFGRLDRQSKFSLDIS